MSEVAPEVLTQFVVQQGRLWQRVALHLSEQNNLQVEIPIPTTESTPIGELNALSMEPVLYAQGGFAEFESEPCLILVGDWTGERESAERALGAAVLGSAPETFDETALNSLREFFSQLMQGLALAFGELRDSTFTPLTVEVKRAPLVLPPNFLSVDALITVQLTLNIPEREPVPLTWLLTDTLAALLLGLPLKEADPLSGFAFEEASSEPTTAPPTPPRGFNPFGEVEGASPRNLDLLMDIPLEVSVELGRVTLLVSELLEIGTGSIVELKKVAGEPVEVLVNGRLIARGEVVVVEDNFAVRITEIISPIERVQRLGA